MKGDDFCLTMCTSGGETMARMSQWAHRDLSVGTRATLPQQPSIR